MISRNVTRSEAIKLGLSTYSTGNPCKHGHICERWVINYSCVQCTKSINAKSFQKHKQKRIVQSIEYTKRNPQQRKSISAKYYQKNKDKLLKNRDKTKDLERLKTWVQNNPHLVNANTARRRAQRLRATPSWVNNKELQLIYETCPTGHEVDHIIPLRHPLVCGLHVPWNLEHLTAEENRKKSNNFEPYELKY